jgi:hypothetical protein
MRPYLENTHHKKELVEWLKAQALSSNPDSPLPPPPKKRERHQFFPNSLQV